MFKTDDGYDSVIGLVIWLAFIAIAVYCIVLVTAAIAAVAAASGTLYGGGTALGNYFSSFKENMINNNRKISA